ncbi:hypothetical protein DV737_g880, partial [Chaetothyriales sp. CBS 132003]
MSSIAASPNPCLVAILLVAQARPGDPAQIIFHYPPDPCKDDGDRALADHDHDHAAAAGDSSSDTSSYSSSSSDDPDQLLSSSARTSTTAKAPSQTKESRPPLSRTGSQHRDSSLSTSPWQPPWHPLLGLGEENLVSLLAPGRTWHKRKFEMGINHLTFVGRPSLTMFHLVCVLDPPPLERALRVREIYDHVAKRLSKVLRIDQAKTNYVSDQAELIQRLRAVHLTSPDSVRPYYSHVASQSALAGAIVSTYRAISQSQVAAVAFSPSVSISMQIPPLTSASYLPSLTERPLKPGIWLTTINQAPSAHADFDPATTASTLHLAKNTTLLLQESPQKIIKGLQEPQGPLVRALTTFMDKLRPTKSFYALSVASKLSLADIQLLARHLIYWRRAVAIPPLHHRDTYIVSPNADMSKLAHAAKAFEAAFPMTPSLPRILHLLSQTPTPYGRLIPSSDHKEEYYRLLAWLLRGGWVTQLCTFAYVRVDPRVKKASAPLSFVVIIITTAPFITLAFVITLKLASIPPPFILTVTYFNGTEALEFIPKREGLKRTVFWDLMAHMGLDISGHTALTVGGGYKYLQELKGKNPPSALQEIRKNIPAATAVRDGKARGTLILGLRTEEMRRKAIRSGIIIQAQHFEVAMYDKRTEAVQC